jgi:hypothetical protein
MMRERIGKEDGERRNVEGRCKLMREGSVNEEVREGMVPVY